MPASAEHGRNQEKVQRLRPTKLQPAIREKAVAPNDLAAFGTLMEAISGEVRQ